MAFGFFKDLFDRFAGKPVDWDADIRTNQSLFQLIPINGLTGKAIAKIFKETKSPKSFRELLQHAELNYLFPLRAVRSGRLRSSFTRSNTPLTNFPDSSVPNFLAISIASLIATTGGTSSENSIS